MKSLLITRLWGIITKSLAGLNVNQYVILWGALCVFTSYTALGLGGAIYVGPIPNVANKHGYVMARSVVINPATGQPILVSYNENGTETGPINVSGSYPVDQLLITSAAAYHAEQQRLDVYNQQHKNTLAKGARLMSRTAFLSANFTAADNQTPISTPNLPSSINSVLVRGQSDRLTTDPNQLVLLSFSFDLTQSNVSENSVSIVVSPEGVVLAQSSQNIGYRTGFYGNPNQAQNGYSFGSVEDTDTIFGPVPYVKTTVDEFVYPGGVDVTNQDGKYGFTFFMPTCPVGGFEFKTDVWAELHYANLLPTGSPAHSYYLRTIGYDYCYADLVPPLIAPAVIGILSTTSKPYYQSNLYADVMFLTGAMYISNTQGFDVPFGDTTHTAFTTPADDKLQHFYDFNGDGQADNVIRGHLKTITDTEGREQEIFEASADGDLQGLYFDTPQAEQAPDLIRVIDQERRKTSVGILESISHDDLRNTDVLFFRESTGQLIMERKGLKEAELRAGEVQLDDENQLVYYRVMLRGPQDWSLNIGGRVNRRESYEEWATDYQLTEPFQRKDSDYIRPGEIIKIVAINRATGYMGTASAKLSRSFAGDLTVLAPPIKLSPPNLKVWAERNYDVEQGLTQGENRNYTIGAEGAALTSDKTITIYTQWLDEYGRPLPEELGLDNGEQYGFTGRLAKVVSPNQLQGVGAGNDLASFAIAPGRKTQVINVGSNLTTAEHYYVHVIGKAKDQECSGGGSCPSFTTTGFDAPYDTRPNLLVPFLVPLPDEDLTWLTYHAYRNLLADDSVTDKPNKPLPAYSWAYRPEYQFSQYGLEMQAITATNENTTNGTESNTNLLSSDSPTIANSDDYITALYSLISSNHDRLTPIDGPQELVLALGEDEQLITIGEDQSITFNNIDHLAQLDPEDFLSMRLYANNDASNILWEYAFEYLDFYPVIDDDILPSEVDGAIEISADEREIDLVAHLIGFANRDEDNKYDVTVKWLNQGSGSLAKRVDTNDDYAIFNNTLTLPTQAGAISKVTAVLSSDAGNNTEAPLTFRVIPGETDSIFVAQTHSGEKMYVGGGDRVEVYGNAYDQFGNAVSDGTGVSVTALGSLTLETPPNATANGRFSFVVSGSDFAEQSSVLVTVGEKEQTIDLTVNPVNVEFINLPTQINVNSRLNFKIKVTAGGRSVKNSDVDVWAENARLAQSIVTTDNNGEATLTLLAPPRKTEVKISAMVAMQQPSVTTVHTRFPLGSTPSLDSQKTKMVGDSTTESVLDYTRWDDLNFSVNKAISGSLALKGSANEQLTVQIGDIFAPNRLTQAAYWMNDITIAKDEVGVSNGVVENVLLSNDTRKLAGNSYHFQKTLDDPARITIENASRVQLPNNTSFVVDIKPNDSNGQIFSLGNGLTLELINGQLTLAAQTDDGNTYSVTQTSNMVIGQWHQVAGAFTNGILTLAIDEQIYTAPVTGQLSYSKIDNDKDLIIGQNYEGLMNSLKWFNLASAPLTTFDNNSETTTVTLNSDGELTIMVNSLGNMHDVSSKLPMQSIAIKANDTRQTIELLSTSTFESIAKSSIAAGLVAGAPAYNLAALNNTSNIGYAMNSSYGILQSSTLFPQAHAYSIDFWDAINVVSSLIGLDSLGVIWDQVGNMLAGRDVDIVAFSVAILDVLTLFPPAAPLKAVTVPAKLGIRLLRLGNNNAVRYLGGVMKKMLQRAKGKDFTLVYQGVAFFIVMADMALDAEARDGITEIAKMINSTDDFLDILDFISLADDEIVLPDTTAMLNGVTPFNFSVNAAYNLFPQAHAGVVSGTGAALGKVIKELAPIIATMGPKASKTLGELGRAIKKSDKLYLKRIAFEGAFLRGSLAYTRKVGISNIRKLLSSKHRIGPVTLIAIIAYLENELEEKRLFSGLAEYDKNHNENELRKLYVKSIPAIAAGSRNYSNFIRNAHGAQFQLLQIGILHALSEAGNARAKVVGIEVPRRISIFKNENDLESATRELEYVSSQVTDYGREIDIITGALGEDEIWREMKSYQAVSTQNRKLRSSISAWTWDKGAQSEDENDQDIKGNTPHRQFILDRIADKTFARMAKKERIAKGVKANEFNISLDETDGIYWHFHDFQTKSSISPTISNISAAFKKEANGKPSFYTDHVTPYKANIFVMGNIDLFLTESKSNLAAAVREEVNDRIVNIVEEN